MLARRFTIVCLLTAIFGMALSMIVEQNARSRRHWIVGEVSCESRLPGDCANSAPLI
ncbi:MAG: hypothetical protein INR68_04630 [Methylobacterium mesophilicum]|nr:hypothetical protein [Methylobacterium mesophilicum]